MADLTELGSTIRDARKKAGMNQSVLAARARVSRNTVSLLETGAYIDIGIRKVQRICALLGLTLKVDAFSYTLEEALKDDDYYAYKSANEGDEKIRQSRERIAQYSRK